MKKGLQFLGGIRSVLKPVFNSPASNVPLWARREIDRTIWGVITGANKEFLKGSNPRSTEGNHISAKLFSREILAFYKRQITSIFLSAGVVLRNFSFEEVEEILIGIGRWFAILINLIKVLIHFWTITGLQSMGFHIKLSFSKYAGNISKFSLYIRKELYTCLTKIDCMLIACFGLFPICDSKTFSQSEPKKIYRCLGMISYKFKLLFHERQFHIDLN